jgi:predicted DNA-binding transcriptional regulator AlpA
MVKWARAASGPAVPPPRRVVTRRRLGEVKGIDYRKTQLLDMIKAGRFPPPDLYLGPRNPAWFEETLDRWLDARAEALARGRAP